MTHPSPTYPYALEKMVKAGDAARTCDKPKRYRHTAPQGSNGS